MPIINSTNHSEMETYDTFIRNAAFSSVTQETGWSYVKNNWEPLYVYLEEEGDIVAAMSVLMVKNIGEKKFAYVSKGPVMNEFSLEYINRLVREAETELKKQQVFLLRMDPEFLYCEEINKSLRAAGFIVRNRELGGKDTIQQDITWLSI